MLAMCCRPDTVLRFQKYGNATMPASFGWEVVDPLKHATPHTDCHAEFWSPYMVIQYERTYRDSQDWSFAPCCVTQTHQNWHKSNGYMFRPKNRPQRAHVVGCLRKRRFRVKNAIFHITSAFLAVHTPVESVILYELCKRSLGLKSSVSLRALPDVLKLWR